MPNPARGPVLVLVLALVTTSFSVLVARQQPNQRTVVVSVLGRGDAPVEGLTDRDFTVREDGALREIVRVEPAAPPATMVLLVDDSQASSTFIREIRRALTDFVDLMADQVPPPAIRLTTFGDRPTVVTDFSPTFAAVSRGIDSINARTGAGSMFLEALMETTRDLRTRRLNGATIVAFVSEGGPEFSNVQARAVATALRGVRATLWTITLQDRDGPSLEGPARERASVLGDVTTESGGRNAVLLSGTTTPQAFERLAGVLLSRYQVTYGRPESLIPPSKLEVAGRDRSWKLQVSRWPSE